MTEINDTDIDGAQEALDHVGISGIDRRILATVLHNNPSIVGDGYSWGWTDTVVREEVAEAVTCLLLGISVSEYESRVRRDESGLVAELMAAHARWVAANPAGA